MHKVRSETSGKLVKSAKIFQPNVVEKVREFGKVSNMIHMESCVRVNASEKESSAN